MKLLVDIKDSHAEFFVELLRNFSFVKAKPLTDADAQLLEEIRHAVEELKLVKSGKIKARSAEEFLNEL
ncbi:MAG TPA: hypothetical protein VE978_12890 [Chitinophagales bacterium]|nr:hypothetical protein [Chitinophagales bacterium]